MSKPGFIAHNFRHANKPLGSGVSPVANVEFITSNP
jgi:hypothetical protein